MWSILKKNLIPSLLGANLLAFAALAGASQLNAGPRVSSYCDPVTSAGCRCYTGDKFQPGGCYEVTSNEANCFRHDHCTTR